MSLAYWLEENKVSSCLQGLQEAGVEEPNDLCEFTPEDLKELAETQKWNLLTRRRVINAIAKLREINQPWPILPERAVVQSVSSKRNVQRSPGEVRATSVDKKPSVGKKKNQYRRKSVGSVSGTIKKQTQKSNILKDGRNGTKNGNSIGDDEMKSWHENFIHDGASTSKKRISPSKPRKRRSQSVKLQKPPNPTVTYHKSVKKRSKGKPSYKHASSHAKLEGLTSEKRKKQKSNKKASKPITPEEKPHRHSLPFISHKHWQSEDLMDKQKISDALCETKMTGSRTSLRTNTRRDNEDQHSVSPIRVIDCTISRPISSDEEVSEVSLILSAEEKKEFVFDPNQCVPDIPELPILSDTRDVVEAIGNLMLDCQNPRVKWECQPKIGIVVRALKAKCTPEFQELLCDDEDVSANRLKKQIKRLKDFKEVINKNKSELEAYLKAFKDEDNPFGDINTFLQEQRELEETLETHKEFAKEYQSAREAHEKAKQMIASIDQATFAEMKSMKRPPQALQDVITGVLILCGVQDVSWANCKRFICDKQTKKKLLEFDPRTVTRKDQKRCKKWLTEREQSFDEDRVFKVNRAAVPLALWVKGLFAIVKVYQRLESFKDGEKVIEAISNATTRHKQLEETIANCRRMEQYMQSIKDQLIFDIELLRSCEGILDVEITQKSNALSELLIDIERPTIPETVLPPEYVKPFDDTCRKIKTRYGDLTEIDMKYTFKMLKKYFVLLVRFYKTYSGMEGKLGQGLVGMSSLMWGVCCQALELPLTTDDDTPFNLPGIFDLCAVTVLASDEKDVSDDERKNAAEGNLDPELGLTGIWRCDNQLWTLTQSTAESFHGFVQNENTAKIKGTIEDGDLMIFSVKWQPTSEKPGLVANCKSSYSNDMTDFRVRYKTNRGVSGIWEVSKTGGKIRKQAKGTSWLKYDDFVEAIMRVGIQLNAAKQPWEALEYLVLEHVLPKALARWNVDPKNPRIEEVLQEKKNKKIFADVFRAYSHARKDKKSGRLLGYGKWEQLCKDLIQAANKARSNFNRPSFRVQQFAFFTSNALFSLTEDVVLNELTWTEFKHGIVRLAFYMVVLNNKKTRRSQTSLVDESPEDVVITKTKVVIKWLESIAKSRR